MKEEFYDHMNLGKNHKEQDHLEDGQSVLPCSKLQETFYSDRNVTQFNSRSRDC